MSDSQNALQKALYAVLAGDAALTGLVGEEGIFDRRMTGKPMPYLVIADIVTNDFGPDAEEHVVGIEAWSDGDGRKEVQTIVAHVKRLLHDAALDLSGAVLVNLQHRSVRIRREPKTKAFVAEMSFRAVTE